VTWFFFALQLLISIGFISAGALDSSLGVVAVGVMLANWLGMWRLQQQAYAADGVLANALRSSLGGEYRSGIPAPRQAVLRDHIVRGEWMRPVAMHRDGVKCLADISYGDAGERNLLDIYRPLESREGGFPILLQVHGGAWFMGHKQQQALPLMYHLAQRGWLCVSINYRLSPADAFPSHIIDVKKAIHWIKENIADYGGNADFLAITGGSAGGHLSALAALSCNDPAYQPGFETADTRVQAAVPFYGVYDFLDHCGGDLNRPLRDMLKDKPIMRASPTEEPELWKQASPVRRVHEDAPPFLVVHGGCDAMVAWAGARNFVSALREKSKEPVAYAELPCAQHAFDCLHSVRTDITVNHVTDFLEWAHARSAAGSQG
jgi:acetyl esterase/lipase